MSAKDKQKIPHRAPFTDGKAVAPHYEDVVAADAIWPTPEPTPPGAEPMCGGSKKTPGNSNDKIKDMDTFRAEAEGLGLTTNQGVKIADNQNTLRLGTRGPGLMEDFHFTEKLAHFDRERIPERVVHARGSGAHGYFQVYKSLASHTKAGFLQDPKKKTPVFVRFSTVQGFRGSPDTVRDIRGFAVKFYTQEGNFDLVGNNTAVFFIQDAVKFPDFVHAVKPEPHNEVPQGQSAHDTFWDYVSLQPETLHNVLWAMSDRGIPRSLRMMEGFGINTFRLVNAEGKSCFVRFHWKPVYGKASLIWDESQALTGRDPDFHRKDLWQAIEAGDFPEWELGLQIVPEEDEHAFDFDILDATKVIPEALVPVEIVGKMTLNRNPDNFFTETEQVAFCPANIVPGIEFSDDPLLQGRVFSYLDTQRHRLGGANFTEIPINRPLCPVRNHQRDGMHRVQIDPGANYEPNSISGNWPREVPPAAKTGGFATYPGEAAGKKVRERSPSFAEYYSHPRLFWISQTKPEQMHIIKAFSFELGKVVRPYIRERVVDLLCRIDRDLAGAVAENLGIALRDEQLSYELPQAVNGLTDGDPALSLYAGGNQEIKSRRVSFLVADGVCGHCLDAAKKALTGEGVHVQMLAPHMGYVTTMEGRKITVDGTLEGNPSLLYDAVLVPEGDSVAALMEDGNAKYHLCQAYKHLKAIALLGGAEKLCAAAGLPHDEADAGLVMGDAEAALPDFIAAMRQHRVWDREEKTKKLPA
ncbi:hydroperoxidase HPII(III) (catalase) [uncultured delta proteobacterium]|uniref:Catalase n=1 Tax=uncultured delta proteobacterium TaxID=34034 RepID=A0A212JF64_9DELT|nr:hydroperoxidase HPII(III) (catalase) [uncultured delta proteobacterium]